MTKSIFHLTLSMSRLLIHLSKAAVQPVGTAVTMAGANLAVASSVVVGMELSGFDSASFFAPVDPIAQQQQLVDSYTKLALSSQNAPIFDLPEKSVDLSLDGMQSQMGFLPVPDVGGERGHNQSTNELVDELTEQEPRSNDGASAGDVFPFLGVTSSQEGDIRRERLGEMSAIEAAKPLSADVSASSGSAETSQGPSKYVFTSQGLFDVVQGTTFDDTLIGSYGADTLIGLAGNDSYFVYSTNSVIVDKQGEGYDSLFVGVESYRTNAEVELIQVFNSIDYQNHMQSPDALLKNLDAGWHIDGNAYAQTLIGGVQSDVLDGKGGSDTLIGGLGNDIYSYTGSEHILESPNQGYDTVRTSASLILPSNIDAALVNAGARFINLTGNELNNVLVGASDTNLLAGGAGDDTLVGAGGEDAYIGGLGADTFVLNGQDAFVGEIQDYQAGTDQIVFSLNADLHPADLIFTDDEFHGVAGEVLLLDGMIQADWNGDAISDVLLLLNGIANPADVFVFDPRDLPGF